MILDAIIALIASIFASIVPALIAVIVIPINGILLLIELVIGIFVDGFRIGRVGRKKAGGEESGPGVASTAAHRSMVGAVVVAVLLATIAWSVVSPMVTQRRISLVAEDGHSLPFAAVVVHTGDGERHERTDDSGMITIPRFGTTAVTLRDPRYVEKTWGKSEIGSQLVVQRTVLGSSLDKLAGILLKPEKKGDGEVENHKETK